MDIKNKFRQALAGAATLALLASNATVAFAGTYFNDVNDGDWFAGVVNQAAQDGIVDSGPAKPNFFPNTAGNRAELVKMVVEATGLLDGFELPVKPTFNDVPTDAWYFKYVEAAAANGIVAGTTDTKGNLTGNFEPGKNMDRAAAAKVISLAYQLTEDGVGNLPFTDVKSSDWFYKYVQAAYGWSVVNGKNATTYAPGDDVTRAEWVAMLVRAQDPVWRGGVGNPCADGEYKDSEGMCVPVPTCASGEYFNTDTEKCELVATSDGDLLVSLNPNSPGLGKTTTLPLGAQNVKLLNVDLKAVGDAVQVTQLKVTRLGVGDATDFDALYLYNGEKRLTSEKTVNSDTNQATFNLNSFVVPKDTVVTLTLVGSVSADAASTNQDQFSVAVATDVTSNAVAVKGTYPATGGTFQMGSVAVSSVSLTAVTISKPTIGEKDAEIGAFKITNTGANDVAVERITITNNGSFDSADFAKLRLLAGSDEVATAESFDKDTVTFVFTKAYQIDSGQNRTFYIHADINGGKTNDTIEAYVDENTDVKVTDLQYGFGAQVVNTSFTIAGVEAVNLEGGDVVLVDNSAASTQIAVNSTEQRLTEFGITADRDLTVRDTDVKIELQDESANVPDWSGTAATDAAATSVTDNLDGTYTIAGITSLSAGTFDSGDMIKYVDGSTTYYARVIGYLGTDLTVASSSTIPDGLGATTELNPYAYIKNVKLVDTDTMNTLAGPLTLASQGTSSGAVNTTFTKTFSEDYDLMGAKTRNLAVMVDIDQNMVAGYRVRATVEYADSYVKDQNANEFVLAADIVGSPLAGNLMSITENTLSVLRSSTPISQDYVLGQKDVEALGVSFQAGDAGDVEVRKIIVRAYGDDGGTQFDDSNGDGSANLLVSTVSLYNGDTLVAGPKGLSASSNAEYDTVTFDQLSLMVLKGDTLDLTVRADLLNTKTGMIAFDIVPSTDVTAEDADNNTLTLSSTAVNTYAANHFAVEDTITGSGSLTASESDSPAADIAVAGTSQMLVSQYNFEAVDESFDVNKLTIINDDSAAFDTPADTSAVSSVTIKFPNADQVMQTKTATMVNGSVTFSGLDFIVPKDGSATLEIYANVAPSAQGPSLSGKSFRLGLRDAANTVSTFEAVAQASSTTVTSGMTINDGANVAPFTVRKTVPTFTQAAINGNLGNNEVELYDVTVKADAAGPVYLSRMVFDVTTSFATAATADLYDFNVTAGGTKLQDVDVNINCYTGLGSFNVAQEDATGDTLEDCDGTGDNGLANGTYKVIVSFDKQQTISANNTKKYTLTAYVSGAASDDNVQTRLATGDEFVPVDSLTAIASDNTGYVFAIAPATTGLFSAATDDVSLLLSTARNFLWSDGSAQPHTFPTLTDGAVTTATGSADWTNGYQLELDALKTKALNTP